MFTGIVQYLFSIRIDGHKIFLYATKEFLNKLTLGDSIAVDGVCLTVAQITETYCLFELSEETILKTTFKISGTRKANIELSLKYGDHLGGHIVSGHICEIGTFLMLHDNGELWIELNNISLIRYKGSITVNGVSLTIAEIKDNRVKIALIPETLKRTNLSILKSGDLVNIEFDLHQTYEKRDDSYYMRLALEEGNKGRVTAPPNPWVGCVIVRDNTILSSGYHKKVGTEHAEVVAINNSKITIDDSTVYITLEPCCHYGRTGPCTDVLINSKVKRVVIGVLDPDNKVNGKGVKILKSANIIVDLIKDINKKLYEEIKYNLRQYLYQRQFNKPYVTLKIALSLDNCYIGPDKWITNSESRKEGHKLRSECQAIIIGAKTAEKDDPELTVRYDIEVDKQPFRIVVDGNSLISTNNKIFGSNTLVITTEKLFSKWNNINVSTKVMDKIDLATIISDLDITHCLIEGGGKLQKSFLEKELVNEIVIFRSPKVFGNKGYRWDITDNLDLKLIEAKLIVDINEGNNIMERYLVSYKENLY